MKPDLYTKAVLTIIAACLLWLCGKDLLAAPATAAAGQPVVIVGIEKGIGARWDAVKITSGQ